MTSQRMSAKVSWFLAWHDMTLLKNSMAADSISNSCSLLTSWQHPDTNHIRYFFNKTVDREQCRNAK